MKLLFISNGFPPEQWAGTETYTAGIAQALQQRGHEVQVFCGGKWHRGPTYWNGYSDEMYERLPVRRHSPQLEEGAGSISGPLQRSGRGWIG